MRPFCTPRCLATLIACSLAVSWSVSDGIIWQFDETREDGFEMGDCGGAFALRGYVPVYFTNSTGDSIEI